MKDKDIKKNIGSNEIIWSSIKLELKNVLHLKLHYVLKVIVAIAVQQVIDE